MAEVWQRRHHISILMYGHSFYFIRLVSNDQHWGLFNSAWWYNSIEHCKEKQAFLYVCYILLQTPPWMWEPVAPKMLFPPKHCSMHSVYEQGNLSHTNNLLIQLLNWNENSKQGLAMSGEILKKISCQCSGNKLATVKSKYIALSNWRM